MDSEKNQGGRPSNDDIAIRREKVKDMLLQGVSIRDMAQAVGVSTVTIQSDIAYWTDYFRQIGQNHPDLAKMELSKVHQTLAEIDIVKKQYWARYQKLLKAEEEQEQAIQAWKSELQAMKDEYQKALDSKDRAEIRRLEKKLKDNGRAPRFFSYHKNLLETLKLIMDRIDKEAKLLNLFNPGLSQPVVKGGITWDELKQLMVIIKQLIIDLVPETQRPYAFQRLRRVRFDELAQGVVVDAEVVSEAPKAGLTRIEAPVEAPIEPEQPSAQPPKKETGSLDAQGLEDLDI